VFSLHPAKNDTSATLDLMRAAAAQIVCIGHAVNLSGSGYTHLPNVGVLLFFLLSGFVIAHTLSMKSRSEDYGLTAFAIERFSRIYTAFLPALLIIAAADYLMQYVGSPLPGDPTDLHTLFGNLTMRQGLSVPTFGSAGQLTTIALEFHIYFFVGAIFFLLKGKRILPCLVFAVFFAEMPLKWLSGASHPALFAMWLAGFGAHYIAASVKADLAVPAAICFFVLTWYWAQYRTANEYDLSNYPALTLAFLSLVIFTQQTCFLNAASQRFIRFTADYSFSLFLIHMTIAKIAMMMPAPALVRIATAIAVSNILAIGFAYVFERHYRRVADSIKRLFHRNVEAREIAGSTRF
jgi:peptidoglycan/LPS O-acetylase OafA/YrhL